MTGPAVAGGHDLFLTEILAQPASLRRAGAALERQLDSLRRLVEIERRTGLGRPILLTGMGSSLDACRVSAALLAEAGRYAVEVETAELLHFRLPLIRSRDIVILVSQSGRSAELVALATAARTVGHEPLLVGVSNGLDNPLARLVDVALDTGAGAERGPATGSFGASLVTLAAVAGLLRRDGVCEDPAGAAAIEAVAAAEAASRAVERLLEDHVSLGDRLFAWLAGRSKAVMVGRGVGWAAASMASLTLKEVAGLYAESLPSASFRHGPLEMAGPDLAAVVFALEPSTRHLERRLVEDLLEAGAGVLWLGPAGSAPRGAEEVAQETLDRSIAAAAAIVPVQLLARRIALAQGRVPGEFRRASKVTLGE